MTAKINKIAPGYDSPFTFRSKFLWEDRTVGTFVMEQSYVTYNGTLMTAANLEKKKAFLVSTVPKD